MVREASYTSLVSPMMTIWNDIMINYFLNYKSLVKCWSSNEKKITI